MTLCPGSGCATTIPDGRGLCYFHQKGRPLAVYELQASLGRLICGKAMRYVGEPCARTPGHRYECRTLYALENARAFGVASRGRAWDNPGTEYSGVPSGYNARRPLPGCTPGEGSIASRSTDEMHP